MEDLLGSAGRRGRSAEDLRGRGGRETLGGEAESSEPVTDDLRVREGFARRGGATRASATRRLIRRGSYYGES